MKIRFLFMLAFVFFLSDGTLTAQNLPIKCGEYKKSGWGRQTSTSTICTPYSWADGGGYIGVGGDMSLYSIKQDFYTILRDGIMEVEHVPCTGSCDLQVIDSGHFKITSQFKFFCKWDNVPVYIQHYIYFENVREDPCDPSESGPDMPSLINIVNELPRKNEKDRTLWSGTTDDKPGTIKICADGSRATRIRVTNLNTNIPTSSISFKIEDDSDSGDPEAGPKIEIDEIYGNTVVAALKHPAYIPKSEEGVLYCYGFQVVIQYGDKEIKIPVQVYRAPVLMFHGLWSDRSAFQKMKERLASDGYCPGELVLTADYSNHNDATFDENSNVVPYYLDIMLNICRLKGYSAGKVDVIGHSMGGLLTRNYLQSDSYPDRQDIHEIITINTPHSGSQLANFLQNPSVPFSMEAALCMETYVRYNYHHSASISNGAVKDLAVNSNALNITNEERLNNWTVPSHTISTYSYAKQDDWLCKILYAVLSGLEGELVFYGQLNDMIVSVPSQTGGLDLARYTLIKDQTHLGSPGNDLVIKEVEEAITTYPLNNIYFSPIGFAPVSQTNPFKKGVINSPADLVPGSIAITWPLRNQDYNPGSTIPVSFSSTNGINRIKFEAISLPENITVIDTAFAFGNIMYKIPQDSYGNVKLIAFGYNSDTLVGFDSLTVRVNLTSTLDSITSPDETIYVREKDVTPVSVTGWFKNGYHYDISGIPGVQFNLGDTVSARMEETNLVKGKASGTNMLTVKYLNKAVNIPVIVFSADTVSTLITSINTPNSPVKGLATGKIGEITLYPNPTGSKVTIRYELIKSAGIAIAVYDTFGKRIAELINERQQAGINELLFDGSAFPAGVYLVRFRSEDQVVTRKLLLLK